MLTKQMFIASILLLVINGCSGDTSTREGEKKKLTTEMADRALQAIQTPIDKAQNVSDMTEIHNRHLKDKKEELEQ